MPLTEKIEFKAIIQRQNRIQIPKIIRWKFKLDSNQVLKITVAPVQVLISGFVGGETFYTHISKDGRITLPLLIRTLLHNSRSQKTIPEGTLLQVRIEPT